MKTYNTIDELQKDSVKVVSGETIAVFPQFKQEETLKVSWAPKFNDRYSVNNSTVAYVSQSTMYVTPYTRGVIQALDSFGLKRAIFYVPFSNGDYPKAEESKWSNLRNAAREDADESFVQDCIEFCERQGIGAISDDILSNCFLMPDTGVEVKHLYYKDVYFPVLTGHVLDCIAIDRLGVFCYNNGRVVFVHRDGHTYVAKGYGILRVLRAAGYRESGLFVPFSNGEVITNPTLAAKWDAIPKQ